MIDIVLTLVVSAFSLTQTGQTTISTSELAPPPGMTGATSKDSPQKPETPKKAPVATPAPKSGYPPDSPETRSIVPAEPPKGVVVENAAPVLEPTPSASGSEAAQPTREERQAPTTKQASGAPSPNRVAAFWFILPARPEAKK